MSLEGSVGGKWSRRACCFSCRREGTNLRNQGVYSEHPLARALPESSSEGSEGQASQWRPRPPPEVPPPHSRVVADADNGPHQETPICPALPPPTCGHRGAPWLCLLWALAVQDTQENTDGGLGDMQTVVSHSPPLQEDQPTCRPTQEAHRGGPIDLVDDQAVGSPTSAQDGLHLRGRLDARAEGFRAAVITGTRRPRSKCQGSQCPQPEGPPGQSHHAYHSKILHKATP